MDAEAAQISVISKIFAQLKLLNVPLMMARRSRFGAIFFLEKMSNENLKTESDDDAF